MPYFEQSCGQVNLLEPIIVDSFAGGGGASVGIEEFRCRFWEGKPVIYDRINTSRQIQKKR